MSRGGSETIHLVLHGVNANLTYLVFFQHAQFYLALNILYSAVCICLVFFFFFLNSVSKSFFKHIPCSSNISLRLFDNESKVFCLSQSWEAPLSKMCYVSIWQELNTSQFYRFSEDFLNENSKSYTDLLLLNAFERKINFLINMFERKIREELRGAVAW